MYDRNNKRLIILSNRSSSSSGSIGILHVRFIVTFNCGGLDGPYGVRKKLNELIVYLRLYDIIKSRFILSIKHVKSFR